RAPAEQTRPVIGVEVVEGLGVDLRDPGDLVAVLVDVRGHPDVGIVGDQRPTGGEQLGPGEKEKRGVTAYRSRPVPCQASMSLCPSATEVSTSVSSASGRFRSLVTSPEVIRRPAFAAAEKKMSIAAPKCAPKTIAEVVPAEVSPVRNSSATAAA